MNHKEKKIVLTKETFTYCFLLIYFIFDFAHACTQSRNFPATEVFKAGPCGFGLRVVNAVGENTILIEYLGEVITAAECTARMQTYSLHDDFYFAALDSGLMLDAKPCGSTARFANHSCDPTCQLQKWTVLGEPRICLVSKRALAPGTEITYNYQYFEDGFDSAGLVRQPCLCGARRCSGTIGGKVIASKTDLWSQRAATLSGAGAGTGAA